MSALGSLVVSLGLEYAKFTGGLDKSEQAALAASKRIQDTMDDLRSRIATTAGAIAGGLAAAFTVGAFKQLIVNAAEANAALGDLALTTGSTVEALSGLAAVGKYTDVGAEAIGTAMNKLTNNLAGATEESKGTAKAIQALGMDLDEFRRLKPEEQMQRVAESLGKYQDSASKAAVMTALYGKEGAAMLPFMKDLADVGELQAKVTTEQAEAADAFGRNLKRLEATGDSWRKELANGMIPQLNIAAKSFLDVTTGAGGLRDEIRKLGADGTLAHWTYNAIVGLTHVMDVFQGLVGAVQIAGLAIEGVFLDAKDLASAAFMGMAAIKNGKFGEAADIFSRAYGDMSARSQQFKKDFDDLWNPKLKGQQIREQMLHNMVSAMADAGAAADEAKPKLDDFDNTITKGAKEAKDAFDALRESIVKATALYQAELTEGEKLTEGQKKAVEALDQLRTGKVKVTQAQAIQIGKDIEAMLAAEKENKTREEGLKIAEAQRAERLKLAQSLEQSVGSQQEQNKTLREEIELIGLTEKGQLDIIRARTAATIATKEATLAEMARQAAITGTMTREMIALQAEIDLLKERNDLLGLKFDRTAVARAVEEQTNAWKDMWASVDSTAHDVFVNVMADGVGAFERIGKTLKSAVLDLLYQMTIKRWIIQIAGVGGGAAGTSAAAAGGNAMGMAGNMASGASLLGGAFGMGMKAGASAIFGEAGIMGALDAGSIALGAGNIAGGLGTIAGALGPIALGIGAIALLAKSLDKSGTPHMGAGAIYSGGVLQEGAGVFNRENVGFGMAEEWTAGTQAGVSAIAKGLGAALDGVAKTFGQKAGYEIATAFADDSSKDGAFASLRISREGKDLINWDDSRQSKWAPRIYADGEEGRKQYLAAAATDARNVLLAMELPSWVHTILKAIGDTADMDALSAAVAQIGQIQTAFVQLGRTIDGFAGMGDKAFEALMRASGGIEALAANAGSYYENFYSEEERMARATAMMTEELAKFGAELPDSMESYRALTEQQLHAGEGGAELAAKLLQLNGAFSQTSAFAQAQADAALAKAKEQADAAARANEAAARDAQALADAMAGLQIRLLRAQGHEIAAVTLERERELAALTKFGPAAQAMQTAVWAALDDASQRSSALAALEAATQREIASWQSARGVAQETVGLLTGIVSASRDAARSLYGLVQGTAQLQFDAGRDFIAQALRTAQASGYMPDEGALREAIAAVQGGGQSGYTSVLDYERDMLAVASNLDALGVTGDDQLSIAQRQLTAADEQIKRLDDQLHYWQLQLGIGAEGVNATLSVREAVEALAGIVNGQRTAGAYAGAIASVTSQTPGDKAALYSSMLAAGLTDAQIRNQVNQTSGMQTQEDWDYLRRLAGVPGFADGGLHAGGLRLVGERGWELEATGPARIWNQQQLGQVLGGGGGYSSARTEELLAQIVGENRAMRQEMATLRSDNQRMRTVLEGMARGDIRVPVDFKEKADA